MRLRQANKICKALDVVHRKHTVDRAVFKGMRRDIRYLQIKAKLEQSQRTGRW